MRELFVGIEAVNKFRHYLMRQKFIIRNNHEALKHLCQQTIHTPEQQRLLPKKLGYDFSVEYKLTRDIIVVDELSKSYFMGFPSL